MTTNNVVYLADRQNGLHLYYPELNERVPAVKMTARLSRDGKHYSIDTIYELKGRGITEMPQPDSDGLRTYWVTSKAFAQLEKQYPISERCLLD